MSPPDYVGSLKNYSEGVAGTATPVRLSRTEDSTVRSLSVR
jgi:hypothetical protein